MNLQKNQEYIVDIIDNGFEGEGIAKIDGFTIFIPGAIKGEKVRILIVKVLSSHAFGKLLEILEASKYRQEADCSTYKRCGRGPWRSNGRQWKQSYQHPGCPVCFAALR